MPTHQNPKILISKLSIARGYKLEIPEEKPHEF